jgi:hypothetical protein
MKRDRPHHKLLLRGDDYEDMSRKIIDLFVYF